MSQIYKTRQGDMIDRICWEFYGASEGYVNPVLDANPGLAELGPVYYEGISITLPDIAATEQLAERIQLW